jgi:hypothetical protein
MAKTRHKNPRTAMRYIEPGGEAIAEITSILGPPGRPTKESRARASGDLKTRPLSNAVFRPSGAVTVLPCGLRWP